ncbi:MAG TPA: hypothetical protein VFQ38_02730 [Longimicrobiales bacterium]|nr:hypothetical protein [Longimicrobiales bacterium]
MLAPLALLAACDLPTDLPHWDTTWVVPGKGASFPVAQLLPSGVRAMPDGSAFQLDIAPTTFSTSLGEMCGSACPPVNGAVVPKPAFTATLGSSLALPAGVASATVVGGTVVVNATNGFSFDPLRPGGGAFGTMTLTVSAGGAVLASTTVDGATTPFPAGSTLSRTLPLASAAVTGAMSVRLVLTSPAGGLATMNTSDRLTVSASAQGVRLGDARVDVGGRPVSVPPVALELDGLDDMVVERVHGGALVLGITNPFGGATGAMTLRITAPGVAPITKHVELRTGTTTERVELTQAELRSILGQPGVVLAATGTLSSASPVLVTPTQTVTITTKLELVLGAKEQ